MRLLQTLISDVEKRIKRGHLRLALNSQQSIVSSGSYVFLKKLCVCVYMRARERVGEKKETDTGINAATNSTAR